MSSVHRSFTLIAAVAAIAVLVPFVAFRSGGASPEGSSGRTAPGEADVWFAPFPKGLPAPAWQDGYGATDFMALFQPGADWEAAASRTNVFKFYVQWVLSASEPDLRLAVGALNQRGISIAVETAGLTTGECGANTEGFLPNATGVALAVARRIQSAGGTLSYLTFDEPLTYAPAACGWAPTRIGEELAAFAKRVRAEFPGVRFGDVEFERVAPWALEEMLAAYRGQGEQLDHLHWDVDWQRGNDWPQRALAMENWARSHGIDFGMIYNGHADDTSGSEWTAHAADHMATYEAGAGGAPDDVLFQSWHRFPQQVLPESDNAALSWLVNRYTAARPALSGVTSSPTASGNGPVVSGHLKHGPGGVAGEAVRVSIKPLEGPGKFAVYTISGVVPEGASTAALAFRVNMECDCQGPAEFTLVGASYAERGGPNRLADATFANPGAWGAFGTAPAVFAVPERGMGALFVNAAAAATSGLNSVPFSVTPGQPFTVTFAARIAPRSAGSGYFAIMWNGSSEFLRTKLPIEAAAETVMTTTDRNGGFQVALEPMPVGRYETTVSYAGSGDLWPAYAKVD